ncbi:PREDICTED: protein TALPID3 [Nanorana parkeri]|uniref:protein TALPID3 n=1 Tax=Nanorana parkeri TaxID=125878 RepID=UPI00085476F6|nr:PREDICTED: protein TALPID3 [Nanorana parkeri]
MQEETSDISLDSVASTTASDVLIRSTSVHRSGSLKKETAGISRRFDAADTSQGLMDLLDFGMVAARGQDSSALSGLYSGRREHRHRDTSAASMRKEVTDRGMEMSASQESSQYSELKHKHPDLSHGSKRKNGQVMMDVPDGEGQEALHVSEVPSQRGVLHGSLRKGSHGETVCSQDNDRSTVHISVKRLREIPAPLPDFTMKKRDPTSVPPALPANKYPAVRFTFMEGTSDAVIGSTVQKNVISKNSKSPKSLVTKHFQDGTDEVVTKRKTLEEIGQKNKEVQISQFTTGQKESVLAALNKRVQSGTGTKEVRVQLLQDVATSSRKSTGSADEKAGHNDVQSATIAAVTAAAIAATAPVMKAQSDLEVQVNSVSQLLNKLQEADRQLQKLTEQQIKIQSQPPERLYHQERVSELERQLAQLTEQRLQHLEKLQQQQLEMQSHFIRSAVKANVNRPEPASGWTHVPSAVLKPQSLHQPLNTAPPRNSDRETSDSRKSPLETPAPRRFAPQPISMDVQPPSKAVLGKENVEDSKNPTSAGKVHFLQQILGHDGTPMSKLSYRAHNPLNLSKVDGQSFSDSFLQSDGFRKTTNVASRVAVQKADDVLQDLNTLKQEMQNLVKDAKQWKSQAEDFQPRVSSIRTSAPVIAPLSYQRSAVNPPESMFKDAKRILSEVQNRRKVFDDNLEAIIRAKDSAACYSTISALTTDSNGAERIRIQRSVDSLIATITSEIQDELAREDIKKKKPEDRVQEPSLRQKTGSAKDIKNNKDREIKAPARGALRSTKPSSGVSAKVQPKLGAEKLTGQQSRTSLNKGGKSKVPQKVEESSLIDEETINRVYGTPVYRGHRSTLKKGPYLRFNSPSPKSKPRRPKVLETVRGVKVKSAKMQTDFPETKKPVIEAKAPEFSVAKDYRPQYVFIPSAEPSTSSVPMEGHLIPIAIPLGRPQMSSAGPLPSAVIRTRPQPVVVNVSVPPQSPKAQPKVVKPNIAVVEVKSEKKEPPQLSVQVLPCVDIDSIASDSPSTSQRTSSAELVTPTPSPVQPNIQLPLNVETEEEILAMPGTSYQGTDFPEDDQEDDAPEPLLELSGRGETIAPQHGGISFPPPVPPLQTGADILEGIISRKETLENKVISWVEQEIMARVISEMHPVRRDVVPDVTISSADQSDAASDTVESPVDSNLIRKYIEDTLADIVATMLRERETRAVPTPPLEQPDVQVTDEISPVPTPQSTPSASPLPSARESSIVKTPELSVQTSVEEPDVQQEELDEPERSLPVHVDTPPKTPVPSPPRVASPVPSEENEEPSVIQAPPPNPWGETELPLEEENPHSVMEDVEYNDAAVMTVAVEEEPRSLISAASSEKSLPASPKQRTPSPVPSPSVSAPSTDESSLTVTATDSDTTDKPISEGEIVYSYGQMAAARALAEGGLVYPNLTESLSSTLRDANDMEFDPPSEGQVIRGPHRGAHRDPVLSLLAKFNQDLVAPHEAFYHLESSGEDSSSGQISEGQRPGLTTAAEQVLVGHSVFMGRPNAGQIAGHPQNRPSSPGQYTNVPGVMPDDGDNISSGPMSIRDLDAQLLSVHYPHADNAYQIPSVPRHTSQGPGQPQKKHQPVPTRFIQVGVKSAEDLPQVTHSAACMCRSQSYNAASSMNSSSADSDK